MDKPSKEVVGDFQFVMAEVAETGAGIQVWDDGKDVDRGRSVEGHGKTQVVGRSNR